MASKVLNFPSPRIKTSIVREALLWGVPDIGLTTMQRRELERAVHVGCLVKGLGGSLPVPVTVYAYPGYDFAAEREAELRFQKYLITSFKSLPPAA